MRIVVAPDSFKGTLTAAEAADAMAAGLRRVRPDAEIDLVPMADGGEGTIDCILACVPGLRRRVAVHDALGRAFEAPIALINNAATAVVELAAIAGLAMLSPDKRDPLTTSTLGVGEAIRAVVEGGVTEIVLAVGGSATLDGGAGMLQGLGLDLLDRSGRPLPRGIGGGRLADVAEIGWGATAVDLGDVNITVACDVLNPLRGPSGAAPTFGPQKGADPAAVRRLDAGLSHWADLLERLSGGSIRDEPGTGAAGGVALPLLALADGRIIPGVDFVSERNQLVSKISRADLVLTGEGRLDAQSMMGKVVGAVGRSCRSLDVPCVALVGAVGPGADSCLDVLDEYIAIEPPVSETAEHLAQAAAVVAQKYC